MAVAVSPSTHDDRPAEPLDREQVRAQWHEETPSWYSPWAHLAFPSLVGMGLVAGSIASLRDLRAWQLFMVPLVFVLSNMTEWRAHKFVLHRKFWPLVELYRRHTPHHHRVFITTDMTMRSSREFRFVLLPFYGILGIFALTFPIALSLILTGQRNLAALFVASSMAYVVCYEWIHLMCHLPRGHWLLRIPPLLALRNHHATHHNPELMQKWNFNVMPAFWDWVRGTTYRGPGAAE